MWSDRQIYDWTPEDIYEYGTQTTPELAHSMCYWVRDVSRHWAERACERDDFVTARRLLARADRCHARLLEWQCEGCRICPAAQTKQRIMAPVAAPTTMGAPANGHIKPMIVPTIVPSSCACAGSDNEAIGKTMGGDCTLAMTT